MTDYWKNYPQLKLWLSPMTDQAPDKANAEATKYFRLGYKKALRDVLQMLEGKENQSIKYLRLELDRMEAFDKQHPEPTKQSRDFKDLNITELTQQSQELGGYE